MDINVAVSVRIGTGFLGSVANFVQLILTCCDKTGRKSVFNLSLISLNVADLLFSSALVLQGICFISQVDLHSSLLKSIVWTMILFSMISSLTHVLFISIQRVIAVLFPFQVNQIITKSRCLVILSLLWTISIVPALIALFYDYAHAATSYFVVITGVLLMIMYSVIYIKTTRRNMVNNASEEMQRRRQLSDRQLLYHSVVLTVVFIICNYPMAITRMTEKFINVPIFFLVNTLFSLNPLFDTLLYFIWSCLKRRRQAIVNRVPSGQAIVNRDPSAVNVPQRNQEVPQRNQETAF